jgi:hypothetical protein
MVDAWCVCNVREERREEKNQERDNNMYINNAI